MIIKVFFVFSLLFSSIASGLDIKNETDNPVGGGKGYSKLIHSFHADYRVSNKASLLSALRAARYGNIIYINDNAKIDLTNVWNLSIPSGVTLASGRGIGSSLGALLYTKSFSSSGNLFRLYGKNIRITGLRIKGPSVRANQIGCNTFEPVGIYVGGDGNKQIDIDNNEIYGWPEAGVNISGDSTNTNVHHNHIHHNRRLESNPNCVASSTTVRLWHGLGYGVVVHRAHVKIEANFFNKNRHDIAGTGLGNSGYDAKYNISAGGLISHSFDMHGCSDRPKNNECKLNNGQHTDRAGKRTTIIDNLFFDDNCDRNRKAHSWTKCSSLPSTLNRSYKAVVFRGVAEDFALIRYNKFAHSNKSSAVQQLAYPQNMGVRFSVYNNTYNIVNNAKWSSSETTTYGELVGDFDGDNIDDYLQRGRCGVGGGACWRLQKWVFDKNNKKTKLKAYNWGNQAEFSVDTKRLGIFVGDFNGDNKDDVGYYSKCGAQSCWKVHFSTGSRFLPARSFGNRAWFSYYTDKYGIKVGDFNGDGKDDISYVGKCGTSARTCLRTHLSSGSAFNVYNFASNLYFSSSTDSIGVLDFNDDGKDDIGYYGRCGASGQKKWRYHVSTGTRSYVRCSTEDLF